MPRRPRHNLGTGIQWGYDYGGKPDPHWRQNRETEGWFRVEDIDEFSSKDPDYEPQPVTRIACRFLQNANCTLWNSGFKTCQSYRCKYRHPEQREKTLHCLCSKCVYFISGQCYKEKPHYVSDHSIAEYCCFYMWNTRSAQYKAARAEAEEKAGMKAETGHEHPAIKDNPTTITKPIDLYCLDTNAGDCIVDGCTLVRKPQLIIHKTHWAKKSITVFVCNKCLRKYVQPQHLPIDIEQYAVALHKLKVWENR